MRILTADHPRDPELRHTQAGTPVASFTLAVDRGFTPKDGGERQTDFIDIVAWRGTAGPGEARLGEAGLARRGVARPGEARRGEKY